MTRRLGLRRKILLLLGVLVLVSPALPGVIFLAMGAVVGGGFFKVHSSSMEPTLYPRQSFLALPFDRRSDLVRGRVVTFLPPHDQSIPHTKRIIGLPGDRVALVNGRPVVNGQIAEWIRGEDYRIVVPDGARPSYACGLAGKGQVFSCFVSRWTEMLANGNRYDVIDTALTPQDDFPETTVPAGYVFVMGDNRDNSIDSRFSQMGMIPIANLTGVAWRHFLARGADGFELRRFMARIR